jgi:class 3 adenylate cyclase
LRNIALRGPGDIIGEIGLVTEKSAARTAVATAVGPVTAWAVRYEAIRHLAPAHQSYLLFDIARLIARKLEEATLHGAAMSAASAYDLELLKRFVPVAGLAFNDRLKLMGVTEKYEKRKAIIFFSDIVSFSDIASQISAEDTATLVRQFLQCQVDAITEREGDIDKFIGDAVMAWWLLPIQNEEAIKEKCSKALAAARESLLKINSIPDPRTKGATLQMRIGLHIGQAYVGNYGSASRSSFTLIGHDVNIAARLEQAREPATGDSALEPIRVSKTFAQNLPPEDAKFLKYSSTINVKGNKIEVMY